MSKPARKPPKARPDWEAIERDYRAGRLSIREVARQNGVTDKAVRNHAAAADWTRDLSNQVLAEAKARAVRAAVRAPSESPQTDAELVAQAAASTADVIVGHRRDLGRLAKAEGQLELAVARITEAASAPDGKGPVLMLDDVCDLSSALWNLTRVRGRRIELERKAWGLDAITGDDQQAMLRSLAGQVDTSMLERLEAAIRESGE